MAVSFASLRPRPASLRHPTDLCCPLPPLAWSPRLRSRRSFVRICSRSVGVGRSGRSDTQFWPIPSRDGIGRSLLSIAQQWYTHSVSGFSGAWSADPAPDQLISNWIGRFFKSSHMPLFISFESIKRVWWFDGKSEGEAAAGQVLALGKGEGLPFLHLLQAAPAGCQVPLPPLLPRRPRPLHRPRGWLQVVARTPVSSFVLGVDLVPIRPIRRAHAIAEDITILKCRAAIKRLMDVNVCPAFDLVLHDGSPNVGGAWAREATSQSALVIDALRLATELLTPKGTFITKVFRSQDYSAVMYCLKQVVDVLRGSKQKRNREGYEDGNTTLWKVGNASDFVWSEAPLECFGSVNALSFDNPESLSFKNHELTTEEVMSLCEDLYVLDKHSFKHLLKWRMHLRKALSSAEKVTSKAPGVEDQSQVDEDDCLLNEMEELTSSLERKKKREKKLLAKRRAKDKSQKTTGMQIDATEDSYIDQSLFSLPPLRVRNNF